MIIQLLTMPNFNEVKAILKQAKKDKKSIILKIDDKEFKGRIKKIKKHYLIFTEI